MLVIEVLLKECQMENRSPLKALSLVVTDHQAQQLRKLQFDRPMTFDASA